MPTEVKTEVEVLREENTRLREHVVLLGKSMETLLELLRGERPMPVWPQLPPMQFPTYQPPPPGPILQPYLNPTITTTCCCGPGVHH